MQLGLVQCRFKTANVLITLAKCNVMIGFNNLILSRWAENRKAAVERMQIPSLCAVLCDAEGSTGYILTNHPLCVSGIISLNHIRPFLFKEIYAPMMLLPFRS